MEIKTKYSIGNEVWYIKDNKVSSTYIYEIHITINSKGNDSVIYNLNSIGNFKTNELFTSKEELLKSL